MIQFFRKLKLTWQYRRAIAWWTRSATQAARRGQHSLALVFWTEAFSLRHLYFLDRDHGFAF